MNFVFIFGSIFLNFLRSIPSRLPSSSTASRRGLYLLFTLSRRRSLKEDPEECYFDVTQGNTRERKKDKEESANLALSSERSRQCATGVLLPLYALYLPLSGHSNENGMPLLALWRRREKRRSEVTLSPVIANSRRGLTIVLLAQIKLATVSRRNTTARPPRGGRNAPRINLLSRWAKGRVNLHIEVERTRSQNRPDCQHLFRNASTAAYCCL